MNNLQRLSDMNDYVDNKYNGTIDSWKGNVSKTFLKALREIVGEETKFHFHCLRHTFAVRRYLQTWDIYQVKQEVGHSSVTTTEIYAKFILRRLEMDFPSLINNTKKGKKPKRGYTIGGYKSNNIPANQVIKEVGWTGLWSFKSLAVSSSLTRVTRSRILVSRL